MRVKDCRKCMKCVRRVWSEYYVPRNYHPIGMSHAYAWCKRHRKRCREVRDCEVIPRGQLEMTEIQEVT